MLDLIIVFDPFEIKNFFSEIAFVASATINKLNYLQT